MTEGESENKSTLRRASINAGARSGLTLSGALHAALKGGARRRRISPLDQGGLYPFWGEEVRSSRWV
jgi:hypothetical protein